MSMEDRHRLANGIEENAVQKGIEINALNISRFHDMDEMHCEGEGRLYLGNVMAARNFNLLEKHKITLVVNCQGREAMNFFEGFPELEYIRFPVSFWAMRLKRSSSSQEILEYFHDLFAAIDAKLKKGHSVLIHCLAGAHRAATVTGAYLMYKKRIHVSVLEDHMRNIRPIIELLPGLYDLLEILQRALDETDPARVEERHAHRHHAHAPTPSVPSPREDGTKNVEHKENAVVDGNAAPARADNNTTTTTTTAGAAAL